MTDRYADGFAGDGCTCPDLTEHLAAALEGREPEPCPTHQPDEHAARERERKLDDIDRQADVIDLASRRTSPTGNTSSHVPLGGDGLANLLRNTLGMPPDDAA